MRDLCHIENTDSQVWINTTRLERGMCVCVSVSEEMSRYLQWRGWSVQAGKRSGQGRGGRGMGFTLKHGDLVWVILTGQTTREPWVCFSLSFSFFILFSLICHHPFSPPSYMSPSLLSASFLLLQHVHKSVKLVNVFLVDGQFLWQWVQVFSHRLGADV